MNYAKEYYKSIVRQALVTPIYAQLEPDEPWSVICKVRDGNKILSTQRHRFADRDAAEEFAKAWCQQDVRFSFQLT